MRSGNLHRVKSQYEGLNPEADPCRRRFTRRGKPTKRNRAPPSCNFSVRNGNNDGEHRPWTLTEEPPSKRTRSREVSPDRQSRPIVLFQSCYRSPLVPLRTLLDEGEERGRRPQEQHRSARISVQRYGHNIHAHSIRRSYGTGQPTKTASINQRAHRHTTRHRCGGYRLYPMSLRHGRVQIVFSSSLSSQR